jgi:hypothetical protein
LNCTLEEISYGFTLVSYLRRLGASLKNPAATMIFGLATSTCTMEIRVKKGRIILWSKMEVTQ